MSKKIPTRIKKSVDALERAIRYSLKTGKGKYRFETVYDLTMIKQEIIPWIKKGKLCRAYDTLRIHAIEVPETIFNYLFDKCERRKKDYQWVL